jgi:hypothetical protein
MSQRRRGPNTSRPLLPSARNFGGAKLQSRSRLFPISYQLSTVGSPSPAENARPGPFVMKAYQELIQDAFSALLCGDAAERDRCLTAALNVLNAAESVGGGELAMSGDPIILPDRSNLVPGPRLLKVAKGLGGR